MEKQQIPILAEEAAIHNARMSGYDPLALENQNRHSMQCGLITDVIGCETGALTNPLIINMALCGDRENVRFRSVIRAAEAAFLPQAKYVRRLFQVWWLTLESSVPQAKKKDREDRVAFCWKQHDFLVCLEPFAHANGSTARIMYYMLATALGLPHQVITSGKATIYFEHQRRYRETEFAPKMRALGYIS